MKTVIQELYDKVHSSITDAELIDWLVLNRTELLEKERNHLLDFHIGAMKLGLEIEDGRSWSEDYLKPIVQVAEKHFNKTFTE